LERLGVAVHRRPTQRSQVQSPTPTSTPGPWRGEDPPAPKGEWVVGGCGVQMGVKRPMSTDARAAGQPHSASRNPKPLGAKTLTPMAWGSGEGIGGLLFVVRVLGETSMTFNQEHHDPHRCPRHIKGQRCSSKKHASRDMQLAPMCAHRGRAKVECIAVKA
jgi:hypothetical protein